MSHPGALPFTVSRSDDVVGWREITSTQERLQGLLRLPVPRTGPAAAPDPVDSNRS